MDAWPIAPLASGRGLENGETAPKDCFAYWTAIVVIADSGSPKVDEPNGWDAGLSILVPVIDERSIQTRGRRD